MNRNKWKSKITINNLFKKALIIKKIRNFFSSINVLEVDTPTLSHFSSNDTYLESFNTIYKSLNNISIKKLFLVTSPEYHMKRLLACGSGPIYQICHSFRNGEYGNNHNPEFSMLEWYRPNYNMHDLIYEVKKFIKKIINFKKVDFISYKKIFLRYLNINPLTIKKNTLYKIILNQNLEHLIQKNYNKNDLLEILFTVSIQPYLSEFELLFIYFFPKEQALLAKINDEDSRVADRFEVFFKGIELANGFCELTNHNEQKKRFKLNNNRRIKLGLPKLKIDYLFLKALSSKNMPFCSGVALGLDRLMMIYFNFKNIQDVITFPFDRC
ncbi:elongation factor P--(R)-beta-lysine ligase [Buchnera aphidicola (Neophyllaphis podocarpi)]|uniref:elongation factor P--(R)-beta-lysine ligase n=1 Tax=Buchnera aphidicola TaxID=9 RepID=UPI0031B82B5A